MSRAAIFIRGQDSRATAMKWVRLAPLNTLVQLKTASRTTDQNAKMWAMLSDIAAQKEHCGRKYSTHQWKALFMHACGQEISFLPSLDGSTFIPFGNSSSQLSKAEMSELIEWIQCWGAQNGVVFHDEAPGIPDEDQTSRVGAL
jgi:hypothetical protein